MMKITQKGVYLLLLLSSMLGQSQESPDTNKSLIMARLQLVKGSRNYNPEKAIASYTELAAQGNSVAMNALGLIYTKGTGISVNEEEGIKWLEKAAKAGYAKAWYNLGIIYQEGISVPANPIKAIQYFEKAAISGYTFAYTAWGRMLMRGNGVPQDYPLAMSIFKQGAEKGNSHCSYLQGYLYYKGFGCTQDYGIAIQHFEVAIQKNNPWAMYMLGLCYRNGYGVNIDLEKAKSHLSKSAAMGVKPSQMELDDPEAENHSPNQVKTISAPIGEVITIKETEAPETFKKVKQALIATDISGNYTGYILRYDFSGQNILSKTSLQIDLNQDGKALNGEWKEIDGDTVTFKAQIQEDAIVFKDSKIDRTEHFYKGSLNRYEFKDARLQLLQTDESLFIVGNLQLYNIKERENEKPMYLILEKKQTRTSEVQEVISSVAIYPNPVATDFSLSFDLAKTADVGVSIYYITGRELYSQQWNNLEQGTQTRTLSLNAPAGYYVLRLTYGTEVKTTILIKK
ncbi:T9SS type A sorting domain-containing protein [Flavobacterium gyeonganense]|uniref:T9SS type A sorting domain-containing protein n=1 Tax=Flavobacterium gyeonganense TaxID=1310418 RepID=A0ABV5HAN6_9FLAO|nr:T9SS type A sorting domain-containing protein [Flavobacterium gyeonganense]